MKGFIVSSIFVLAIVSSFEAQSIVVSNTQTPTQLVNDVLLGQGVNAFNVTINGNSLTAESPVPNVTYFSNTNSLFPFGSGLLLTTGNGTGAIGPNNSGSHTDNIPATSNVASDPHLSAVANGNVTNGVVLEFDFVPSGDTVSFNYIFGSDEYPEFSPSSFNDAFGLFLWGPGINGPHALAGYPNGGANIAVIPGNIPVTINNVGDETNTAYYVFNESPNSTYGDAIQYDGTTVQLAASASVSCNEIYHIKLAIANVFDQSYDSGVFLQAGSFVSDAVNVSVATVSGDSTIVEGCTDANFIFTRPESDTADTLIISYEVGGVAIEAEDYNNIPDSIVFLPGEDTVIVTLTPFQDGLNEGFESVTVTVELVNICGDTIVSSGVIYIGDGPIINIDESDTLILCASDSVLIGASASGGYAPYTYEWFDIEGGLVDIGDSIYQGISENGTLDVIVEATDNCDFSAIDTVTITLNQTLSIDTILVGPATCQPDGYVSAMVSGETTTPQQTVYYSWAGSGGQTGPAASVWIDLASGWYYVTVEDAVCVTSDSAFVDLLNPPIANLVASPSSGCGPLAVTFDYSSSENGDSYDITYGDGTGDSSNELGVFYYTYDSPSSSSFIAQLVVSQGDFCKDSTTVQIQIEICGCMDPVAENYNELATIDDGSCIYPVPPDPIVTAPNVFTPNGDTEESNEEFFLESKNLSVLRLIIFNRWGNVVFDFESSDVLNNNPSWNGKTEKGEEAEEGVYFYKYEAIGLPSVNGIPGIEIQGHGFLQLIR